MGRFLEQARERRLLPWMLAYLVGAWVVLQLLDGLGPTLDISHGAVRGTHALLVLGFFVSLVVTWYHGEPGRQQPAGMELVILILLLLVAAGLLPILVDEPFVVPDESSARGGVDAVALVLTAASSPGRVPDPRYSGPGSHPKRR